MSDNATPLSEREQLTASLHDFDDTIQILSAALQAFRDDMERIERGEDPKAIMRDPKENERIQLPIVGLDAFRNGLTSKELENAGGEERLASKKFIFQAGQPPEVKRAYEDAMGFKMTDW